MCERPYTKLSVSVSLRHSVSLITRNALAEETLLLHI